MATDSRRFRRRFRWGAALAAVLLWAVALLTSASSFAQETHPSQQGSTPGGTQSQPDSKDKKEQKPPELLTTKIRIQVNDPNDKPVANASVYVRYYESGGFLRHEKLAEMNFKTSQEGSVKIPEIPQGKILIQVIAKGWHTFGKWYDMDKEAESVAIKLEAPPHWY
jgi:hypothetical protein